MSKRDTHLVSKKTDQLRPNNSKSQISTGNGLQPVPIVNWSLYKEFRWAEAAWGGQQLLTCQGFKVDHKPQLHDWWVAATLEGESYGNLPLRQQDSANREKDPKSYKS